MNNCNHCYCIDVTPGNYTATGDITKPHKRCCNCHNQQLAASYTAITGLPEGGILSADIKRAIENLSQNIGGSN